MHGERRKRLQASDGPGQTPQSFSMHFLTQVFVHAVDGQFRQMLHEGEESKEEDTPDKATAETSEDGKLADAREEVATGEAEGDEDVDATSDTAEGEAGLARTPEEQEGSHDEEDDSGEEEEVYESFSDEEAVQ